MFKKILIYNSGGGIGDSILLIPLIRSIQDYFKTAKIYYLGSHKNHFDGKLKEYGVNIENLDLNLKYYGFRWWHFIFSKRKFEQKKIGTFDLIIDCQSKIRNTIILKQLPSKLFYSSTFNYIFCKGKKSKKNLKNHTRLISEKVIDDLNQLFDLNLKNITYKTEDIPIKFLKEAKNLLPDNNYIGFSLTQGNAYRKKSWPIEKFITLGTELIKKGKKIVFFIEKKEIDLIKEIKKKIPNAYFPEHQSALSCPLLVTALSTRLEKAVSIDNGIMHMIGLSGVPMIILFGPTDPQKFAPKRENIKIIESKKLYDNEDVAKIRIEDVVKEFNY